MATDNSKCGALVGEKSQTVHSANWKLDAMLKREKQMLDVSKRRVEHRITMDKQVVKKRFHIKLHRSRLHHARLTGNTDMLQKLLAQGSFDNNYGAGNDESPALPGYDRPRNKKNNNSVSARLIRAKEREMRATVGSRLSLRSKTPQRGEDIEPAQDSEMRRSKTAMGLGRHLPLVDCPETNRRPKTALPQTNRKVMLPKETQYTTKSINAQTAGATQQTCQQDLHQNQRIRPVTADIVNKETNRSKMFASNNLNRPKTAQGIAKNPYNGQYVQVENKAQKINVEDIKNGKDSPTVMSTAKSEIKEDLKTEPSSIFSERPKKTLLDVQMNRIRRSNFPKRITVFAESIPDHLKVDGKDLVDIYSAGLVDKISLQNGKDDQSINVDSPRKAKVELLNSEVNKKAEEIRCIGNIYAPNMTFKELNTNYENVKSDCIEAIPFQRRSSGLAGILRHKTASNLSIPSTAWESDDEGFDV